MFWIKQLAVPVSSECGTHKTVKARLWPWFQVEVLKTFKSFLLGSEAVGTLRPGLHKLQGYLAHKKQPPLGPYSKTMPWAL